MRILSKVNGFRNRKTAEGKLVQFCSGLGPSNVGFVIANADGTFSPAIFLTTDDKNLARQIAEIGIHVFG